MKTFDIDVILRLLVTAGLFLWNLVEGAVFENSYPLAMVKLYKVPFWRLLLVVLLILAVDWCPSVAVMLAFFIFFYIMDMEVTLEKWSVKDLKRTN